MKVEELLEKEVINEFSYNERAKNNYYAYERRK